MLHIDKISFVTKLHTILYETTCSMEMGHFVAIVGANGAGKSTLMRCVSGEYKASTGRVTWKGKEITEYKSKTIAQERSMLTQSNQVSAPVNVEDVVLLGRYPHYEFQPSPIDNEVVRSTISHHRLEQFNKRIILHLSGGEQQRVHLARVMAQLCHGVHNQTPYAREKLLLLDEPLNNLDIRHQIEMLQSVKAFAESGNTVVAVLHDLNLAINYAHQIIMMKDGRILANGAPHDVLTEESVHECFEMPCEIHELPKTNKRIIHFIN